MQNEPSGHQVIRFGTFELDVRGGELRKQGIKIKLQEQPLRILELLLARPGQLVTREELRTRLWPSDTFVDFDHGLNKAVNKLRETLGDSAETPRFIETVPKRGYRFVETPSGDSGQIRSLLILPLANLSQDPEQDYFADGMTEALTTALAKIGALRVLSRTTAEYYKRVRKPLPEIARELGVDGVVEGSVLRSEGQVRISAQLLHAPTDTHLWAESYDREMRDILALQAEVAGAIARQIQVNLTPHEKTQLAHALAIDTEAYEAYLKGRYYWNRRPVQVREAIKHFQEAIAKDPAYVAPYAGLADCFSALSAWGVVPASEGCVKAKALAQRALELDPSSPEAHTSLGRATMYHYEFEAAERELERSIELNPRYGHAHQFFGWFLTAMGRFEEAYTELKRALRLDPLSSIFNTFLGLVYLYGRRYDQAIEQLLKTLELDPTSGPAYGGLAWAYRRVGQYDPAIAAWRTAIPLWPGSTCIAWLGETYAAAGDTNEARKVLAQLGQLSKERYVTPYGVARVHAALGEREEALRWLETAYQQRAEWMVLLKVDPCFDDFRPDPRFQDFMRRMNFSA